jgi:cobalt-zinc-cadmium efflux system outer membrane protein
VLKNEYYVTFAQLMRKVFFLLLVVVSELCFSQQPVVSIDTLAITLNDAEDQFLKNNFALLAQKYSVDASKALVRQAGLFNNPNIYFENSVYNPYKTTGSKYFPMDNGKYFGDVHSMGETLIQYNWLFSVAGKRSKSVKVTKAQADVAQYQFDDLMRTLVFALRSDFYQLYYGLQSLKLFDAEIASLKDIVTGFETQYQKGNISLREITRVRALLFSLQNDRLALATDLRSTLSEFAGLLNNPKPVWYKPTVNETEVATKYNASAIGLSDLLAQALTNRPDLKEVQAQVVASEANLKLQKAIGVPDVMLQGVYDRNGSYIHNYNAAAIQIPIAIFNRNQGNTQAAKSLVDAANQQLLQKQVSVQNDVFASFQKMTETEKLNSSLNANFATDFSLLLKGAQSNFEKKNLSLLEFVDMFESYKQSMVQYNTIKTQRLTAFEELNFNVGKDVFKK